MSGDDGRRQDPGRDAAGARAVSWRLVLGTGARVAGPIDAADGAANMAVDHALLESVKRGAPPALRFYRWDPDCVSLGRNQPGRGRYDGAGVRPGVDVVRRPTGGLAVHHAAELTYAVACPVGAIGSPRATYARINRALVEGLRALGAAVETVAASSARIPHPGDPSGVCFAGPAPGEVVAGGRKLAGSAQRCEERTLLQHGSILLAGDQRAAIASGGAPGTPAVATLAELLGGEPADDAMVEALARAFEAVIGIRLAPVALQAAERDDATRLDARYRSGDWTWRR